MVRACVHFAFFARVDMVRAHFAFLATLPPLLHMCRYNVGLCVDMVRACVHFAFLARVGMVRACVLFAFLARVDMVRAALCVSRTS